TLEALAYRALAGHAGGIVRVVQDARMGEVYTADFGRGADRPEPIAAERVIKPEALAGADEDDTWLHAGNGWPVIAAARHGAMPDVCEQWPHALDIARLGAVALQRDEGVPAARALPVYVRDDVARKPGYRPGLTATMRLDH